MRIVYVLSAYPLPFRTYIVNEMIEVQKAGHEIVLAPLHRGSRPTVRQKRFDLVQPTQVLSAPLLSLRVICDALFTFLSRPVQVLRVLLRLHQAAGLNIYQHCAVVAVVPKSLAVARALSKLKVDHIHAHFASHTATVAALAGQVSGIPYSFTGHAYDIYAKTWRARNDTLPFKLKHAAHVFAVSKHGTHLLRKILPPQDGERIQTVYVGIPVNVFKQEPMPPRTPELRMLCITRFEPKKGLDTLIAACALLREQNVPFRLKIYGDGPPRESLANQISRLRLNQHVVLGGYITQEEVARALMGSHVFVMPCREDARGDMDGIPTVFMEAMAVGRPVISCPIAGIPELVRDGETGLLVPPNDPSALAAAVRRLGDNDVLRIQLGRQARQLVEKQHDQRANTKQFLETITRVAACPQVQPIVSFTARAGAYHHTQDWPR